MSRVELRGKTVLVTGVAGFIGSSLARRLLSEEAVTVVGIDNLNDYYDVRLKEARLEALRAHPAFVFVRGSVADRAAVDAVFAAYRPQIVVHLAAQPGVRASITHPEACMESNLTGFLRILEACRHAADGGAPGVKHLVFASSSSVYGCNGYAPCGTDDRTDSPVSLYAATKKSNELFAHAYAGLYGIPATGLRLFTVYGPWGRPDMAYFRFTDRLRAGETIRLFNYGNCSRDFTYIDDVVESMVRVMQRVPDGAAGGEALQKPPYAVYNVGNGRPVRLLDFVAALQEELIRAGVLPEGDDLGRYVELAPMQPGDVPATCADTGALERDFGFRPRTALRDGLRGFAQWYRAFYMGPNG